MKLEKIVYKIEKHIALISMDYMKNLNAIDEQMADELIYVIDQVEKDPEVKVAVLKGTGKVFSAGGDIGFFYKLIQQGGDPNMDSLIAKVGTVADGIKKSSKIYITSVAGPAAGAGLSLAIAGDFMICAENAKFIPAFVNVGLVPDTGAAFLLTKAIGTSKTMELAITGRVMDAAEAKATGLAYKVTPPEELDSVTMKFAEKLATGPLISYKNIKRQIYDAAYADYKKWLTDTEMATQAECACTEDFKEGVKAFIEKRKPQFSGR